MAAAELDALVALLRGRKIVALTGAGCSTDSGIPDYRGPTTPVRLRPPIQHREFVDRADARRRYWARSLLGWPRLAGARPNAAHEALVGLEVAGAVVGVITQNVDGLHGAAGSRAVVELHGAIARVRCLACDDATTREVLQARMLAANPTWRARAHGDALVPRPDGDIDLPDDAVDEFVVVACTRCGGVLMPDVVFFGGSVPRATLDAAWAMFDRADALIAIGTSLTVFSGYRFVRRAAERGMAIAILNHGETRGDPLATVRVDARIGDALPEIARRIG